MKQNTIFTIALVTVYLTGNVQAKNECGLQSGKAKLHKEIRLKDGVVKLATLQVNGKNQDPIVAFVKDGQQVFCRQDYDTSAVDARAVTATADAEHLYIAFSADGGSQGAGAFARFTKTGWISSYGKGGGPKVLVVLKLRKADGEPVTGTYIIAKRKDGKTNSVALKRIAYFEGAIGIEAESWSSPLNVNGIPLACEGAAPFVWSLVLTPDLKTAKSSSAGQCH
ncbi:MAG: hypothetical protein U1F16_10250 [Turneriella sp.]